MLLNSCGVKSTAKKLENIDEESPANWLPATCPPPETPTESMEFLARSWSLSAVKLTEALFSTHIAKNHPQEPNMLPGDAEADLPSSTVSTDSQVQQLLSTDSPPVSPRGSDDTKELFLLHQALNPDFLSSQQLLKNGLYRSIMRGKTMGRWLKDQKERKKQDLRIHNAQVHAAVSVAGVAAAVAAIAATSAASPEKITTQEQASSKTSAAIASAAALVASHCIEMAEDMGAEQDHILSVVGSAINARTNGDIMALTAGAATALRGATTLRARLQKGYGATTITFPNEQVEEGKESNAATTLHFISKGGELLKCTRKGALHWKQVSFKINASWQVVAKMKSKHMAGTFTKKKKCVVYGVCCDIPAWTGREKEDSNAQRAYFGIKTADRVIEFECRNKCEKEMWTLGIQQMLNCRTMI